MIFPSNRMCMRILIATRPVDFANAMMDLLHWLRTNWIKIRLWVRY